MDDGSPRVGRRDHLRHVRVAIGLSVLAALGVAGCSGGGDSSSSSKAATTTTVVHGAHVDLRLGDVSAASAGPAVTVSSAQSQRVLDLLAAYVKDATVQPLRSGKPATADLSAVFDPITLTPATTTDRGVV